MFVDGKRTARQGNPILVGGKSVGIITSACPSPTLDRCIAMGFVDSTLATLGTALEIDTGRGMLNATTTAMPFYKLAK
jgi:aminomethyltransferase